MLAERLLAKGDYDCDKEIRTLELLKIRFGENNLLNCEARPCCKIKRHRITRCLAPFGCPGTQEASCYGDVERSAKNNHLWSCSESAVMLTHQEE